MSKPLVVRPLSDEERATLETGLRAADAFTLRRCQILLASAAGSTSTTIAHQLHCGEQTVRNVVRAFNAHGLAVLTKGSTVAHHLPHTAFDAAGLERLQVLIKRSPRTFGKPTSLWTLDLLADVCFAEGLTARHVSGQTIRATLQRLGITWKRAKRWITSPDPAYTSKKRRDRLIVLAERHADWVLGFADEVWWSRLASPELHGWQSKQAPLRLLEQRCAKDDPDAKALACYGVLVRLRQPGAAATEQMLLRFVDGRPVSAVSIDFLQWCSERLQAIGKTALLLIWDNASWHISKAVRSWIRAHNRRVKQGGAGVRIVLCLLPSKSPWLNAIEPKWVHGKRAVVEPDRLLTAQEIADRACAYYDCAHEPHLVQPQKAP